MTTLGAIWLLFGGKSGDNAQVEALGARLAAQTGWNYKVKQLKHQRGELLLHLASRPTLLGIDPSSRSQLAAPWPELVITAGRRNELVALWIRQRSPATRLVHVGRPWCHPSRFDLVITTAQYCLEADGNVLQVSLPLNQVDTARIDAARLRWGDRFAGLPGPRTVVLLGGNSGGYVFDERQARRLGAELNELLAREPGSLLISTSARTPSLFAKQLLAGLRPPEFLYCYGDAGENPYFGLLAWGDRFVVTEDSVSMVAEAMATGREVLLARIDSARPADGRPWWRSLANFAWKPLTHRLAQRFAPRRYHRDVRRLYERLIQQGGVGWLGETPAGTGVAVEVADDLAVSVARVRELLERQVPERARS